MVGEPFSADEIAYFKRIVSQHQHDPANPKYPGGFVRVDRMLATIEQMEGRSCPEQV